MAASDPLDAVETLRQEIKALEAEINSLNNRIDILIKAQEDHPERWDRLQDEILEFRRQITENKRQITEKQTTVELITRQQLTLKRGPSGQLGEERHSKSSRSSSPYSAIDALHGKPARDLLENSEQVGVHAFFAFQSTASIQDLVRTALSSTLGSLDVPAPSEDQIQNRWDAFAAALFTAYDAHSSSSSSPSLPQSEARTLSYFNTSNKPIFSHAQYRPDISLCEARVKEIKRVIATNIVSLGELKRDPSCFNDPIVIHQLARYASRFLKETPSQFLKCFVATNLAIRGFEFWLEEDDITMPRLTHVYDLQSSEGIDMLACFLLPPKDSFHNDFGFRGLHVEGWEIHYCLGHGACSRVFAAKSTASGGWAAIKVSHQDLSRGLLDDVRFMKTVTHSSLPTLVNTFHYHPGDNQYKKIVNDPYISVDAIAITPIGRRYSGKSFANFYPEYVDNLADAVKALHDKGIVHRDIRPDNIIFVESLDSFLQRAILIDLGFCCRLRDQPCPYSGTLRYASDAVLKACATHRKNVTVSKGDDLISLFYTILALADCGFSDALHQADPKQGVDKYILARRGAVQRYPWALPFLQKLEENPSLDLIREEWRKHVAPANSDDVD